MTTEPLAIAWFRQDLRIADNPALNAALAAGRVLPIYIVDDINAGDWARGAASRAWLHHSLASLDRSLGSSMRFFTGDASEIITRLVTELAVTAVFWNRCYEPWRCRRDTEIKRQLQARGLSVQSFNASLLWEPWEVAKKDGSPYRVFTPFYQKGCHAAAAPRQPLETCAQVRWHDSEPEGSLPLAALKLLPPQDWHRSMLQHWRIGEAAAATRLEEFCATQLANYRHGRDFPALDTTSRLSPHLHFGEISPHQLWHRIANGGISLPAEGSAHFQREIAWREFSYHLLYHFPALPEQNFNPRFVGFDWHRERDGLAHWQQGNTGFPIVDAGLRELWQTGYMHNRVRMVVASFLIKNMLLHWRNGADWFWDCLVDADLANNSASWQWCAGSGADAAPYFRIFNPVLQSEKFDPAGDYLLRYCPELGGLPAKLRHKPWAADDAQLSAAGIELGVDYPLPILDLKTTRERALERYRALA